MLCLEHRFFFSFFVVVVAARWQYLISYVWPLSCFDCEISFVYIAYAIGSYYNSKFNPFVIQIQPFYTLFPHAIDLHWLWRTNNLWLNCLVSHDLFSLDSYRSRLFKFLLTPSLSIERKIMHSTSFVIDFLSTDFLSSAKSSHKQYAAQLVCIPAQSLCSLSLSLLRSYSDLFCLLPPLSLSRSLSANGTLFCPPLHTTYSLAFATILDYIVRKINIDFDIWVLWGNCCLSCVSISFEYINSIFDLL